MLYDIYQDIDGFMTPVEIFKPYYAEALAKYIVNHVQANHATWNISKHKPLKITEVGGGNGTCAKGVLDFLRHNHKDLYSHTEYEIIDVSEPFHNIQKKTLADHLNKVKLVNKR